MSATCICRHRAKALSAQRLPASQYLMMLKAPGSSFQTIGSFACAPSDVTPRKPVQFLRACRAIEECFAARLVQNYMAQHHFVMVCFAACRVQIGLQGDVKDGCLDFHCHEPNLIHIGASQPSVRNSLCSQESEAGQQSHHLPRGVD